MPAEKVIFSVSGYVSQICQIINAKDRTSFLAEVIGKQAKAQLPRLCAHEGRFSPNSYAELSWAVGRALEGEGHGDVAVGCHMLALELAAHPADQALYASHAIKAADEALLLQNPRWVDEQRVRLQEAGDAIRKAQGLITGSQRVDPNTPGEGQRLLRDWPEALNSHVSSVCRPQYMILLWKAAGCLDQALSSRSLAAA